MRAPRSRTIIPKASKDTIFFTPVDVLRETYQYNETCQGTVPEAIRGFMEAEDFESAFHNAISIGGNSETLPR